jgi:hypothetical protein
MPSVQETLTVYTKMATVTGWSSAVASGDISTSVARRHCGSGKIPPLIIRAAYGGSASVRETSGGKNMYPERLDPIYDIGIIICL